jgi:hypothetical protein
MKAYRYIDSYMWHKDEQPRKLYQVPAYTRKSGILLTINLHGQYSD